MQRIETSLPEVYELRPVVHRDSRGAFLETYRHAKFSNLGIKDTFLQDNHSISSRGTLRGLYKCGDYYWSSDEHGILWNDTALAIDWGASSPALPQRDAKNPKLADVQQGFLPRYSSK